MSPFALKHRFVKNVVRCFKESPLEGMKRNVEVFGSYQRCRVKLRDHVMQEDCEVSRPRLQQLHGLKTATLTVHLRQMNR